MVESGMMGSVENKGAGRWLLWGSLLLLAASACLSVFMYFHPGIFPMHGFSGPEGYAPSPANARLTGDSWRYISGGAALLGGDGLDGTQRGYSGYCLVCGLAGGWLVCLQVLASLAGTAAVLGLARSCWGDGDSPGRLGTAAILASGAAFALNPEFGAWHCAIMTESLYTSAVCVNTWLATWARRGCPAVRMPLALAVVALTCFLRPTGWMQLPAVLLYWCFAARMNRRWKWLGAAAVVAVFLACAALCSSGIGSQKPTEKLYSGEVVWQEDLWRVDMPAPADSAKTGIGDGLLYGLRHPLMSAWLALKRLAVMFLRVRPAYSAAHNAFLMLFHLPMALLGLAAMVIYRKKPAFAAIAAMVLAHALVVALTFNDNDGRFSLYFTPILATAALILLFRWIKSRIFHRGDL